jgi:hypothetical protein
MDRKRGSLWTGLLVSLLFSVSLFAQTSDDAEPLQPFFEESVPSEKIKVEQETVETPTVEQERLFVEVTFSPEQPVVNTPWRISMMVDYSHPEYVGARPPEFPEALRLDEMRIEPLIREDRSRWTAVRWTFIPQSPVPEDPIHLGSFQITAPGKIAFTDEMDIIVLSKDPAAKNYRPHLVWDKIQTPFEMGASGSLLLRLFDWNPLRPYPKISLAAPEQAILEEIPLTQADIARSAVLRLSLIPLTVGEVTIPRLRFKSEGVNLEIPSLTIQVVPSTKGTISPQTLEPIFIVDTISPSATARFPETVPRIPAVFFRIAVGTVSQAKTLWEHGEKAEALALVRRNERDGVFGFAFAPLRKDMEQALGLVPSHDETWIPKKVCLIAVFCSLTGLMVVLFKRKPRQVRKRASFASVLAALAFGCLAGFWNPLQRKTAVFHTSDVYPVPEFKSAITGQINDGQWAIIRSMSNEWVFAESDDLSGWILFEKAVFY